MVDDMLLAQFASFAFAEFAAEALVHQVMKPVAERFEVHLVDDLVDEGCLQQQFGFLEADAPLLHVEEGGIIDLSHGASM
jgi:hypothetical protein